MFSTIFINWLMSVCLNIFLYNIYRIFLFLLPWSLRHYWQMYIPIWLLDYHQGAFSVFFLLYYFHSLTLNLLKFHYLSFIAINLKENVKVKLNWNEINKERKIEPLLKMTSSKWKWWSLKTRASSQLCGSHQLQCSDFPSLSAPHFYDVLEVFFR